VNAPSAPLSPSAPAAPPGESAPTAPLPSRTPIDVLGLTSQELIEAARLQGVHGAGVAARLYPVLMREGRFAPEELGLGSAGIASWRAAFSLGLLTVVRVVAEAAEPPESAAQAQAATAAESSETTADAPAQVPTTAADGATAKVVLRTHDGYEIECVRIPMRRGEDGRQSTWSLCISSQVGCRMGCTFCETGRMGLLRNLSAAEIVAQVVTVRAVLGWEVRNLVFMGMGEALDNAEQVIKALHILTDRRGLGFSQERLTICTSGHAEGLRRLAALGWKRLNLSLSLNAAEDQARSRIMPVNRRTPLAELQGLLAAYPQRRNFILGVNYCLIPGLNDGPQDAQRVADFCRPLGRVLVNLIPYNPGSAPIARAPSETEVEAFIAALRGAGLPVRRRVTKGRGIMAACGQLGNVALRRARGAPQAPQLPHAEAIGDAGACAGQEAS